MSREEAPLGTKPGDESPTPRLGLFQGFGVEVEYMIVDRDSLDVRPRADALMEAMAGSPVSEWELNGTAWSNELALHVLEMKTNGPAPSLRGLSRELQESVVLANELLEPLGCRLLPGGAHPWMDPDRETRLWPHEYDEVYRTFDRIFSCRGHGWSNLQSVHVNLPFSGDDEFRVLHAALRVILPLLPALAASSPFLDGTKAKALDARLSAYRANSRRIPSVAGRVIPEPASSQSAYERDVLGGIYADLAALDPDGVLRHEWVNARGIIPRFQRGTVEVRILDAQECPVADLALVATVAETARMLTGRVGDAPDDLDAVPTEELVQVFDATVARGEEARVRGEHLLEVLLGRVPASAPTAAEVWSAIIQEVDRESNRPLAEWRETLDLILSRGPLARRILAAAGPRPDQMRLRAVYRTLADALEAGRPFLPEEVG